MQPRSGLHHTPALADDDPIHPTFFPKLPGSGSVYPQAALTTIVSSELEIEERVGTAAVHHDEAIGPAAAGPGIG